MVIEFMVIEFITKFPMKRTREKILPSIKILKQLIGYVCGRRTWTSLTEHRHQIEFMLSAEIHLKGKNVLKWK